MQIFLLSTPLQFDKAKTVMHTYVLSLVSRFRYVATFTIIKKELESIFVLFSEKNEKFLKNINYFFL